MDAPTLLGLKAQMYCVADPSAWDPISGKSPVHIAGEIHRAGLIKALTTTSED
jgi:thymidylate synthase